MPEQTVTIKALLQDKLTGGLAAIGRAFKELKNDVGELKARLAPITGQVAGVVAAFASLQAANKAIAEAAGAADAQRRLLAALRGNRAEMERIADVAARLGIRFAQDDDDVAALAATLLNFGVSVNEIDKTLEAVLATAESTGQSIDAVAISVAKFGQEGSGRLGGVVKELKDLEKSGELASKGVDLLLRKYAGVGDQTDDFKKAVQLTNDLNNELGEQGKEFIKVKVSILSALIPAVKQLTDFLKSDTGQGVLQVVIELAARGTKLLPIVLEIAAAIAGIKIAAFLTPIALVLAKWILIGVVLGEIVKAILDATGFTNDLRDAMSGVSDSTGDVLSDLRKFENVLDSAQTRAKELWIVAKAYLFDPLGFAVRGIAELFIGLGKVFASTLIIVFDGIVLGIKGLGLAGAEIIDSITDAAATALSYIPGITDETLRKIRTNLKNSDFLNLEKQKNQLDDDKKQMGLAVVQIANALPSAFEDAKDGISKANDEIGKLETDLMTRREGRYIRDRKRHKEEADKKVKDERVAIETIVNANADAEKRLADLRAAGNDAEREKQRKRDVEDLLAQFEEKKISLEKFVEERKRIEIEPLDAEITKRKLIVDSIAAQITAIRQAKGANADVHAELDKQYDAEIALQTAIGDRLDALRAIQKFEDEQRRKAKEESLRQAEDSAKQIADLIKTAREEFDAQRSAIRQQREGGFLFESEATQKDADALDEVKTKMAILRAEYDELIRKNPELADKLAKATAELEKLGDTAEKVRTQDLDDLFRGFEAGANNTIRKGADLRETGLRIGESFANAAGDIAVGFTEADFSFSNFAGNFLRTIGQMLIKLAVFRALAGAFGLNITQGLNRGGPVLAFDGGGPVPGPRVHRDVVDAKLTPGEWVMREAAVNHYGEAFMAALNHRLIPRDIARGLSTPARATNLSRHFAEGGSVGPGGGGSSASSVGLLVLDPEQADRLSHGIFDSLIRRMGQNPGLVRSAIRAAPL